MLKLILVAFFLVVNCQQQHQLRPRQQWYQGCQAVAGVPTLQTQAGWTAPRRGVTACVSINLAQRHNPLDIPANAAAPETNPNVHFSIANSFPTNELIQVTIAGVGTKSLQGGRVINGAFTGVTFATASNLLNGFTLVVGNLNVVFGPQNFGTTDKEIIKGPIVYNFANAYPDVKERNWDPVYVPTFTPLGDFILLNTMGLDSQSWTSITAVVVKVGEAVTDIKESDTVFVDLADCVSSLYEVEKDAAAVYGQLTTSNYCVVRRGSIFGIDDNAANRHIRQPNPFGTETPYGWF